MTSEKLLEVKNVSKLFPGVVALDNVNFTLHKGSIHSLCGENGAGKSTLMHILMGVYQKNGGTILFKGKSVNLRTPKMALETGISIIEQELSPIPDMTVAENIFLGREPISARFFVNYRDLNKRTEKLLQTLDIQINPTRKMKTLSLAEIQLIEIAKAISYDSDVLIMDEPTTAIGEKEVEKLFTIMRQLQEQGKGIIYVSHKLEEVFTITDRITVFRDGKNVKTALTKDLSKSNLVSLMVGRKLDEGFQKKNFCTQKELLRVNNLSRKGKFHNVNLSLCSGQILGIFGLMGSGRSEFLDTLFGLGKPSDGEILIEGKPTAIDSPKDAIFHKIAYVTEDRKATGLVLTSSVKENISIASLQKVSNLLFINRKKETGNAREMVRVFSIKTPSLDQMVVNLSGGNQQKVVLSKWLLTKPKILLIDEPTRGIDIGAKQDVYNFIAKEAERGTGVIMVSSELPELLSVCDHINVFKEGTMVGQFDVKNVQQDEITHMAA